MTHEDHAHEEQTHEGQAHDQNAAATPRPARGRSVPLGLAALVGVLSLVLGSVIGGAALSTYLPNPSQSPAQPSQGFADVAASVGPSVVQVNVSTRLGVEAGSGAGFAYSSGGYVVTNNHVVSAGGKKGSYQLVLADGTEMPAALVGSSAAYDLAVLKASGQAPRGLDFGDSDATRVGEPAVAFGSPLGLQGTVTAGIISAVNRPVRLGSALTQREVQREQPFISALQTDAAINPGNSGGPLVNARGQVIGVDTAIATLGETLDGLNGNIGVGFAIPSATAKRVVDEIIATGSAAIPYLGISIDNSYTGRGARVLSVVAGGPADKAGVKAGDVVTALAGFPISGGVDLVVQVRRYPVGTRLALALTRSGRGVTAQVTSSAMPEK